jgi:hypothetical protein
VLSGVELSEGWYKIRIEGAAGNKGSEGYVPEKHFSWNPKGI